CASQVATAIERAQLSSAAQRCQVEAETERLRSSLLSAVSHDLRTPLSAIVTAGTTLLAHRSELDGAATEALTTTIVSEPERLNPLITNLLSATRLDAPGIALRRTPESFEELLASARSHLEGRLGTRRVQVRLPHDLPWISVEPVLVEQLLTNLLENAIRY